MLDFFLDHGIHIALSFLVCGAFITAVPARTRTQGGSGGRRSAPLANGMGWFYIFLGLGGFVLAVVLH